jgi:hypothetical protein
MVVTVAVTDLLLRVTDGMSEAVFAGFEHDIQEMAEMIAPLASTPGIAPFGQLLVLIFATVGLLAAMAVLLELFVRAGLIYIVIALSPFIYAAAVWESMRGGVRKMAEIGLALILSKFVIAVALALSASAMTSMWESSSTELPTPEQAAAGSTDWTAIVGILLSSIVMFAVSAFMPLVLFKLLPVAEAATVAAGVKAGPLRGAQQAHHVAMMGRHNPAARAIRQGGGSGSPGAGGRGAGTARAGTRSGSAAAGHATAGLRAGGAGGAAAGGSGGVAGCRRRCQHRSRCRCRCRCRCCWRWRCRGRRCRRCCRSGRCRGCCGGGGSLEGRFQGTRCSGAICRRCRDDRRCCRRQRPGGSPARSATGGWSTRWVRWRPPMSGRTYSLEPLDKTGVLLGYGARELAVVGSGLFLTIGLRLTGLPGLYAVVPFVLSFAAAKAKVGSRPVLEWVPLLAGWAASGMTGRRQWSAPLPLLPTNAPALPPMLRGVEVVEVPVGPDGRTVAAVATRRGSRLTAVLPVRGSQFAALDRDGQDGLLDGWGGVLSGFAEVASPVVQIGWSELVVPDDLARHRSWCNERLTVVGVGAGDPDGYLDLVDDLAGVATARQTVVWLTVDGQKAHDVRGRPSMRAAVHLPIALDNLAAALRDAGLTTAGPLAAAELRQLLRDRLDPCDNAGSKGPGIGSLAERLGLVDPHEAGPMAVATQWSQMHVDASFHRTFWVSSWPRRPVAADWLNGFLAAGTRRALTVVHCPLDPATSQRRIEGQLAKLAAHEERKHEKDRRITEQDLRTEDAVHALEMEVASGHSEVLYLGLVTVSAPSLDALDACRHVVQSARSHGLGLRVLHGRQDLAWAAALPFGLVDPGRLAVMGL